MANILDKLQKLQTVMSDRQIRLKAELGGGTVKRILARKGECKQATANKIIELYDKTIADLVTTKTKE